MASAGLAISVWCAPFELTPGSALVDHLVDHRAVTPSWDSQ